MLRLGKGALSGKALSNVHGAELLAYISQLLATAGNAEAGTATRPAQSKRWSS